MAKEYVFVKNSSDGEQIVIKLPNGDAVIFYIKDCEGRNAVAEVISGSRREWKGMYEKYNPMFKKS